MAYLKAFNFFKKIVALQNYGQLFILVRLEYSLRRYSGTDIYHYSDDSFIKSLIL